MYIERNIYISKEYVGYFDSKKNFKGKISFSNKE